MKIEATVFGFRSTFRDWVAEHTAQPTEVDEISLAHAVGHKVEAAYRRGDLLAKRVQLMQDWAEHLARSGASSRGRCVACSASIQPPVYDDFSSKSIAVHAAPRTYSELPRTLWS